MTAFTGDHDEFVNELLLNTPESYDGDDAAEAIAVRYVHDLEDAIRKIRSAVTPLADDRTAILGAGRCTIALDDEDTVIVIDALTRSAQAHMYHAKMPGAMHPGDLLVSARINLMLARKISRILPSTMIPSNLRVMEHAIAIALTDGTRHEGI